MPRRERFDADYFPFYAKDGRTLTVLQHKHGLAGIGFFTNLMRALTLTPRHYIELDMEADRLYFFAKIGCDDIEGIRMVETMVNTGKLHRDLWKDHHVVFSPDLCESLTELYRKRQASPPNAEDIMQIVERDENSRLEYGVTEPETGESFIIHDSVKMTQQKNNRRGYRITGADIELTARLSNNRDSYTQSIVEQSRVEQSRVEERREDLKNGAADEKLPDESESMPPWPDDEDLSQPAADPSPEPPVTVSPKPPSRMKDELADHYQTKMLKVQPVETWGNVRVEREQLTVLAGKTRKLRPKTPFSTDVELADAILITYYHARDQGRDSYWKGAPFSPSALSTRWAQVITMLEQSFKSQIAAAEFDRKQQDAIDWLHGGKR